MHRISKEEFDHLNRRFGFTVDGFCQFGEVPHLDRQWRHPQDHDWSGERVLINGPMTELASLMELVWSRYTAHTVVVILPANRHEQQWWQSLIEPFRDRCRGPLVTEYRSGRPSLGGQRPRFGVVLAIWNWYGAHRAARGTEARPIHTRPKVGQFWITQVGAIRIAEQCGSRWQCELVSGGGGKVMLEDRELEMFIGESDG